MRRKRSNLPSSKYSEWASKYSLAVAVSDFAEINFIPASTRQETCRVSYWSNSASASKASFSEILAYLFRDLTKRFMSKLAVSLADLYSIFFMIFSFWPEAVIISITVMLFIIAPIYSVCQVLFYTKCGGFPQFGENMLKLRKGEKCQNYQKWRLSVEGSKSIL